jgi:hypothetical protein
MSAKAFIYIMVTIDSTIFSWIGDIIGHGWFSFWSLFLGTVGCFVGIWMGYWLNKNYLHL